MYACARMSMCRLKGRIKQLWGEYPYNLYPFFSLHAVPLLLGLDSQQPCLCSITSPPDIVDWAKRRHLVIAGPISLFSKNMKL